MQARFLILPGLPLVLVACASPADKYPSLAIRDNERMSGVIAAPATEPYVPADPVPATLEQVDSLAAQARAAHEAFLAAAPETRSRVAAARGADVGSDAWSAAQVAMANLESRRNPALVALASLDRVYTDISSEGRAIAPIEATHAEVAALVDEQDALIAGLLDSLAP